MAGKVTRNDLPDVEAVKGALLAVLSSGRSRAFDGIEGDVAKVLGLSRAQRSYRIGKSKDPLFANRLVQARSELTKEGTITYKSGRVKLVKSHAEEKHAEAEPTSEKGKRANGAPRDKAPEGRPTKCLSFQEPYASYIVTGAKDAEFRSKRVNVPIRDLVVCASKTPKAVPYNIPGLAYGMAIGMVDVVECIDVGKGRVWKLENPRLIKPFPVHATAWFFFVADTLEVIPNTPESYRDHVLPHCFRGDRDSEDEIIASLFSAVPDKKQVSFKIDREKFDLVKRSQKRPLKSRALRNHRKRRPSRG